MALGGGIYTSMNKKLAGTYVNFVGVKRTTGAISDRGISAVALPMGWGELGSIVKVDRDGITGKALEIFGVPYTDESLKPIREMFCHATTILFYRLGTGGTKASNNFADAKYVGVVGNSIATVIHATTNGREQSGWNVKTYLGNELVDEQTIYGSGLTTNDLDDNAFVTWKNGVELSESALVAGSMAGGANPDAAASHGAFLTAIENYAFNCVACSDTTKVAEYVAFIKNMRDELGSKCQCVVYDNDADYEGIISVKNNANLVYWLAGAEAGCEVNASCTNMTYDGELTVDTNYDQSALEDCMDAGKVVFHKVGDEVRVLEDINSLVTYTSTKTEDFRYNQTIRVLDQLANDIASIYNENYIGKIPNDDDGRAGLWADIVAMCDTLQNIRAIEDFDSDKVSVIQGATKKAVVAEVVVTPVNAMAQLYCTIYVE